MCCQSEIWLRKQMIDKLHSFAALVLMAIGNNDPQLFFSLITFYIHSLSLFFFHFEYTIHHTLLHCYHRQLVWIRKGAGFIYYMIFTPASLCQPALLSLSSLLAKTHFQSKRHQHAHSSIFILASVRNSIRTYFSLRHHKWFQLHLLYQKDSHTHKHLEATDIFLVFLLSSSHRRIQFKVQTIFCCINFPSQYMYSRRAVHQLRKLI